MAARRPLDAHRLPGARAGEGDRLRRHLRRGGHAARLRVRRRDVVRRRIRPGARRLGQGRRQRASLLADATFEGDSRPDAAPLPDLGFRLDSPAPSSAGSIFPPFAGARRRRGAASATTSSSSIRTARCATRVPFVRIGPRVAPVARPRRGAARGRHRAGSSHARRTTAARSAIARCRCRGAHVATRGRAISVPVGAHRFPRSGAARRSEEPHLSDLLVLRSALLGGADSRRSRSRTIDPAVFNDKIVFVGVDRRRVCSTSSRRRSRSGKMPGIQIHAAVADDILSNRFMRAAVRTASASRRSSPSALAVGLVATCCRRGGRRRSTALHRRACLAWIATRLFASGYWLNLSQPVLGVVVRAVRRRRLPVLRRRAARSGR